MEKTMGAGSRSRIEHFHKSIQGWFFFQRAYLRAVRRATGGEKFVEIGSWKGRSTAFMATEIANSGKQISFYAVDHWRGSNEIRHRMDRAVRTDTLFEEFVKNISPVAQFVTSMRMTSLEAASQFDDRSISFVWLDAGHSHSSVKEDLTAWVPKLIPGGVIGGDDWLWPGVRQAVREVFREVRVEAPKGWPFWWTEISRR